jgi:outer membrane protein TolC
MSNELTSTQLTQSDTAFCFHFDDRSAAMSDKRSIGAVVEAGPLIMACVLVATLCLLPFARAQVSGAGVLTLDEALLLAHSNNRDLKQYGIDVTKQREAVGEAKTHLYPRLDTSVLAAQLLAPIDFTVQKGQFGTFPGTGPIPGSDTDLHTPARPIAIVSVTATQPLTQLIRIHLFVAEQRLKADAAQLSLNEREQKLMDEVRQSYYRVLQSQVQYESQQSMVKYLEELQQLTDRRFSQQAALEADRLSVKAEVAKATYELTTVEDLLADRKEILNHLLGRSLQTEFSVEPVPATLSEEESLTAARVIALERRPEVKLAVNRVRQAELATKSEKTHYIPDIAIQASYLTPANINFLPQNVGAVGALLTWQPWDWGEKRHKVRQAALAEKQAGLSVEDTREQVLLDVDSNFRHLREARSHLAVTEATREAEAEKMRNQKEAYSQQSILLSDLLKQQSSLAEAESQYHQALLAYWSARADFKKTLGAE